MVDAPIPRPHKIGHDARNAAMNTAKDELRNKLDTKNYDKGFDFNFDDFKREMSPEEQIQDLILRNPTLPPPTMAEQETSSADRIRRIKKAGSLSIVSSDHAIEDSPNAGHVNENIGRSTAFSAIKTLKRRHRNTSERSRPLGQRMRQRYVYEDIDISEQATDEYTISKGVSLSELFRQNIQKIVKENENEIADGSDTDNSPKEKKNKMEKRGNLVTVNPKLNDDK
jgi:hypothetical protein